MALDKVVDSAKLEADLTTVADAIRTKGGTAEQLAFPEGFKTAIDGIQAGGGGGQELADSIIDGSVTEVTRNVTSVRVSCFEKMENLKTASFPVATIVSNNAFRECHSLTTVSFPKATDIGEEAFYYCFALSTASFPSAASIGMGAFQNCKLITADFPSVTSIGPNSFQYCNSLTTASFPSAASIGYYAFFGDKELAEIHFEGSAFCNATGDPYINSTCKIYVPAVLFEQYKTATNWSKYANQFIPVGAGLTSIPGAGIITDNTDTGTRNSKYVNFTHGEVKVSLDYDTSKLLVTAQVVPDAETPGNGTVQLTIKALTAPAEVEANTVSVTVSDDADSYTQEFTVNVVKTTPTPVFRVEPIEGAANGFALNSAGYYESQNKGKGNSYALCKIVYNTFGLYHLYLDCINDGESNYDFGLLSNPGVTLPNNNYEDSSGVFHSFKGKASKDVQVVDYGVLPSGENFITAKFRKDGSGNSGNDSLQFKVRMEL